MATYIEMRNLGFSSTVDGEVWIEGTKAMGFALSGDKTTENGSVPTTVTGTVTCKVVLTNGQTASGSITLAGGTDNHLNLDLTTNSYVNMYPSCGGTGGNFSL